MSQKKKRYLLGPFEDPDVPMALMCLETAVDDLRERFASGDVGDEMRYRIVEMTDSEVDALPEL